MVARWALLLWMVLLGGVAGSADELELAQLRARVAELEAAAAASDLEAVSSTQWERGLASMVQLREDFLTSAPPASAPPTAAPVRRVQHPLGVLQVAARQENTTQASRLFAVAGLMQMLTPGAGSSADGFTLLLPSNAALCVNQGPDCDILTVLQELMRGARAVYGLTRVAEGINRVRLRPATFQRGSRVR